MPASLHLFYSAGRWMRDVKGLMNVVVRLYIHYIYLMQGVERGGGAFFKGISLSEYMKDMACPEEEPPY
jgi:hypothetical protein